MRRIPAANVASNIPNKIRQADSGKAPGLYERRVRIPEANAPKVRNEMMRIPTRIKIKRGISIGDS
jgi:hypothetical protein